MILHYTKDYVKKKLEKDSSQNTNQDNQKDTNSETEHYFFLHGFLGSSEDWAPVINNIQSTSTKDTPNCIPIDLPGHGNSPISKSTSFDSTIENLSTLIKTFSHKNNTLIGYSLGGRIGLLLSLKYPELFKKIIIISAHPGLNCESEKNQRNILDLSLSKKIITEPLLTFLENWYKNPIFSTFNTSQQFNTYLKSKLKNSPTNLSQALIAFSLSKQLYTLEKLKTIETKLTYISGQEDKKYVSISRHLKKQLPSVTISLIKNAGHNVHITHPDEISSILLNN